MIRVFLPCLLVPALLAAQPGNIRTPVDPVGFATKGWQMDSIMERITRNYGSMIEEIRIARDIKPTTIWKAAICPHDDYAYAGWLYPLALENIKAPTVILIGVAHKASKFGLSDKMIFGSYPAWQGPYQPVKVSELQARITNRLPKETYLIHDSLHTEEHSLEALIPFLQYYTRHVEIIPVLIPFMSFETMKGLAGSFALALSKVMEDEGLEWRRDLALVISSDAVHYGCEDWGGDDYAPLGCDSTGYIMAVAHEYEIIHTLTGKLSKNNLRQFTGYTVQDTSFESYRWTWCGRYSIPFGLLTALYLQEQTKVSPVRGTFLGYSNSIDHPVLPVVDLKMGVTAPANIRHWVGYVAIGYR